EVAAFTLVDIVFNKGSGALSCFLWGNHCESSLSGRENSMTGTSAEKCWLQYGQTRVTRTAGMWYLPDITAMAL
ncbi:TPA: hypothetical protein ACPFFK_005314, partial [Escherichia coli]